MEVIHNKMQIEIWSDVMCPFCYLGKRRFDAAMSQFEHRADIEITWKSFQLMPAVTTDRDIRIHDFLAREKGIHPEQARQMNNRVTEMGSQSGVVYNFDKVIVANTFDAHRFIHAAKEAGKQHEAEEVLFKAFFEEGKNIDDFATLIELGRQIGLEETKLSAILKTDAYANEVKADVEEARQLGIHGVPYFVLNRKYGVSGAQEIATFLNALQKAYGEWKSEPPVTLQEVSTGASCNIDGTC